MIKNYREMSATLVDLLKLSVSPVAMKFTNEVIPDISHFESEYPSPTPDGRTGAVSAGCVFWMKAEKNTFSTVAADHANCSVGCLTHGLKSLDEVAGNADVQAVCEAGWVSPEIFPSIPCVRT